MASLRERLVAVRRGGPQVYRSVRGRRSLLDAWALTAYAVVSGVGLGLATTARGTMAGVNSALVATFDLVPPAVALVIVGVVQVVYVVVLVGAPAALALTGRLAVLGRAAVAFALALLAFGWVDSAVGLSTVSARESAYSAFVFGTGWPPTGALAAYTAAATVTGPAVPQRWRRAIWGVLGVLAFHRIVTAASAPTDVVLAIGVGGAVGSALLLAFGRSTRALTTYGVEAALERAGLSEVEVIAARASERPWQIRARTPSGPIRVKVVDEHDWRTDRLFRAYRRIRLRDGGGQAGMSSPGWTGAVVVEAMLGLLARTRDVRVPQVRAIVQAPGGELLLATDDVDGASLADVEAADLTAHVLGACWEQVARLRAARIAHHDLRLDNLALDGAGLVWVTNLDRGETAAGPEALAADVAELLASSAARVGPARAVAAAQHVLGSTPLTEALARLVPAALSPPTRSALASAPQGLQSLVDELCRVTGVTKPVFADIERVKPRTLITGAFLAVAAYLLAPQLANVPSMLEAIRAADVVWIPAVLLASVATYVGAGLGLAGGTPGKIPATEAGEVALASSFIATFTPPGVGPVGLNIRYLQKKGYTTPVAVSASAAKEAAVLIVHLVLLAIFAVWAGRTGALTAEFARLPPLGVVAAVAGGVFAVVGVAVATPPVRRLLRESVLPAIRDSLEAMRGVVTSPGKLLTLFGGVVLLPLGDLLCLYFALEALGGGPSLAAVGVVALTAGTIATATPIPGGIGAVEAVLLASFTGLGVAAPHALAAVFLYRLASFWLPIAPGALVYHRLTRREVL